MFYKVEVKALTPRSLNLQTNHKNVYPIFAKHPLLYCITMKGFNLPEVPGFLNLCRVEILQRQFVSTSRHQNLPHGCFEISIRVNDTESIYAVVV